MDPAEQAPLPPLSVVIAVRNEASRLPLLLADLAVAPHRLLREVVVVDGSSTDATVPAASLAGARSLICAPGRGQQLAAGVRSSDGPWLLLLHGDVRLAGGWATPVQRAIAAGAGTAWCFRLAIDDAGPGLRLVELAVGLRTHWRRLPYGDQGLLVHRRLYEACGGIAPLPLMEDLDFVLRLRRRAPLRSLGFSLRVDGRRWRRLGIRRTTLLNARLRKDWRRGVPPEVLAQRYYGAYQKAQRRSIGSSSQPRAS